VELDVTRPFAQTLESLFRQRLATRIHLRRITELAVQDMLAGLSGSAPPSGLSQAVFKETEGNPFFVEEVYQHLAEEGWLFDATGAWRTDLRMTATSPRWLIICTKRAQWLSPSARRSSSR
jgi:predicted ATPase